MRSQGWFRVAIAVAFILGCHAHSATYAPPPLPPPPGPVYLPPSAEAEATEVAIGSADDSYEDNDPSALDDFRGALDAHGTWVDDSEYGTVWLPSRNEVGPDFVPYTTAGHWVYDDDYVWVSDYPWGWAPFHYGRWVLIAGRGWAWIPGRVYAGAWVSWRIGDVDLGFVGWAPMPPVWIWRNRIAVGIAVAPPAPFVFCPRQEIFAPRVSQRIVRGPAVIGFEGRTHVYVAPPAYPAGARVVARPMPAGPPPVALRIDPSRVVRLTPREESVYTARRYALPSTARQVGARAPTPHVAPPRPAETRGARFPLGTAATQPPSPARPQPPQRIPAAPLPRAAPPVRAPPQTVPRRPAQTPAPGSQALPRPAPRSVSPSPGTPPAAVPRPPLRVPQRVPVPQRVAPAPSVHR